MIIALEGPDCCGKTTAFEGLQTSLFGVTFVPGFPMPAELLPVMPAVERRMSMLWQVLADPLRTYVCDRHFSVSGRVYDELYGRQSLLTPADVAYWQERVSVVLLCVPVTELQRRYANRADEHFDAANYERCVTAYDRAVAGFRCIRVNATKPKYAVLQEVRQACIALS